MHRSNTYYFQENFAIARASKGKLLLSVDAPRLSDDGQSFGSLLRSCTSLHHGMLAHESLIRGGGSQISAFYGNSFLQMYTNFGAYEEALAVFSKILSRDAFSWTLIIKAHSHCRELALACFQRMLQEGIQLTKFSSISILSACTDKASYANGKRMHAIIFASGLEKDVYVATAILSMYGNSTSIHNARETFERMSNRDAVAWNAMISAYIDVGKAREALTLFQQMQDSGIPPTKATFLSILEACASLASIEASTLILEHVFAQKLQEDVAVGNAVINVYSKCGDIENARDFFDQMRERDTISWNTIIAAYTRNGQERDALALFDQMQEVKIPMDKVTFVSLLSACVSPMTLLVGERLHNCILCTGMDLDVFLSTALVSMYGKCGRLEEANIVFNTTPKRDIITWNAMISAYGQHECCDAALSVFDLMQENNMKPDKVTFVSLFNACACEENLTGGRRVHEFVRGSELEKDVMVGTALIRMYGACGCLEEAEILFEGVSDKDVILWNSMIVLYHEHEKSRKSLIVLNQMLGEGVLPNKVTFSSLLNAYASQMALAMGKRMHACCVGNTFELDIVVATALANMYGKCGCLDAAHLLFDRMHARDLVAWTTMISLYAQKEHHCKALQLFLQLQQEGLIPDIVTVVGMISACASEAALVICKQVHTCVMVTQFISDIVLGNALISAYSKCSSLKEALATFEQMPKRDSVSFLNIICACASEAAPREGQKVHDFLVMSGVDFGPTLSHALVTMYGKCGLLKEARLSFEKMTAHSVISCNSMITAYSQCGNGEEALILFEQMQAGEIKPDNLTIVSVLTACSHAGLVDEGFWIFLIASQNPSVSLILDHYNCMVDILARAGQLDEAEELIKVMPLRATVLTWTTLLGACKTEVDVKRGERIAALAMSVDPNDVAIHVSLSNIYSTAGRMALEDMECL